jgi:hypothetical protein
LIEGRQPLGVVDGIEAACRGTAGVVQGNLEAAVGFDAGVNDFLDIGFGVDVGGDADDLSAGFGTDFGSGFIDTALVAAGDDQFDAFAGEPECAGVPEAAAGSKNNGAFACESEVHVRLLWFSYADQNPNG